MKKIAEKLLVILFILLMLVNNSLLIIISKAFEQNESSEEKEVKPVYELELNKYNDFDYGEDNKGLLVGLDLKTGIEFDGEKLDNLVDFSGVVLNLPKVNNEYPLSVEIDAISTKSTNGENVAKDVVYDYNIENGKVRIITFNAKKEDESRYEVNEKNLKDQYMVYAVYGKNCYNLNNKEYAIDGKAVISFVEENVDAKVEDINKKIDIDKNVSGVISADIYTSDIYDGFIKVNNNNEEPKYNTEYREFINLNIGYTGIANEIKYSLNNVVTNNEEEKSADSILYKKIRVNKRDLLDKLGENGNLKIYNKSNEEIFTFDKNVEENEDGYLEFSIENDITDYDIVISEPVKKGLIRIENDKEILAERKDINNNLKLKYSVDGIKINNTVDETTGEITETTTENVYNYEDEKNIEIKKSVLKSDITVSNSNWVNNNQNDIVISADFDTSSIIYSTLKNTVVEFKMPNEVEDVVLGSVNVLNDENVRVSKQEVIDSDSCKVIRIELEGAQKEYNFDSIIKGPSINIPASIIVKKDIGSTDTNVEVKYYNDDCDYTDYKNEGKESKEYSVNIESNYEVSTPRVRSLSMVRSVPTSTDEITSTLTASVGNHVLEENEVVYENQIIKYNAKIINNTDSVLNDIRFYGIVPEGTTFASVKDASDVDSETGDELYEYGVDSTITEFSKTLTINAHEEVNVYYEVKVNSLGDATSKNISSNLKVYKGTDEKSNFVINNVVNKADLDFELKSWRAYVEDDTILYRLYVKNNKSVQLNNVNIDFYVPSEFEQIETETCDFTIERESDRFSINVTSIEADGVERIDLYIKVNQSKINVFNYHYDTYAVLTTSDSKTYYSNENRIDVKMKGIQVTQTCAKEGKEVKFNEEIEYNFKIKNLSDSDIFDGDLSLKLSDYIDSKLKPISVEYDSITFNEETGEYVRETKTDKLNSLITKIEDDNLPAVSLDTKLPIDEEINVKVKVKARYVIERTEVYNNMTVEYSDNKSTISNTIKVIIVPNNLVDETEEEGGTQEEKPTGDYITIDGKAWEDLNNDGKIGDEENKLQNLKVYLIDLNNNEIAKTSKGKEIITETDENGYYKFDNISLGRYIVAFEYDYNEYGLSEYKKSGISESKNSDVVLKEIVINGEKKKLAISDIINGTERNINIGLVPNSIHDLSLNKSITKVSVEYNDVIKETEYDEAKLAKVEIPSKKVNEAKITVEYQLEIKNEGNIPAYVDEIIDYKPEVFEFDGTVNENWNSYGSSDLHYLGLKGVILNPGESKKIKLILTKQMNENSTGVIINAAEIKKSTNYLNLTDKDSVEGNKNVDEDDYSEAGVIISIGTGIVRISIAIALGLIVLLVVLILCKNNRFIIKNIGMFLIISIFSISLFIINDKGVTAESAKQIAINDAYDKDNMNVNLDYNHRFINSVSGKWNDKSGDTGHYITHTSTGLHKSHLDFLWCSDGRSMCSSGKHLYNLKKSDITVTTKVKKDDDSSATIEIDDVTPDTTKASGLEYDEDTGVKFFGPIKVDVSNVSFTSDTNVELSVYGSTEGDDKEIKWKGDTSSSSYYDIYKKSGSNYIKINSKNDIARYVIDNGRFYIGYRNENSKSKTKRMKISTIELNIEDEMETSGIITYTATEKWRCYKVEGSHTSHCSTSNCQVMLRKTNGKIEESKSVSRSAECTIELPDEGGRLRLLKVEDKELASGKTVSEILVKENVYTDVLKNNNINAGFSAYDYENGKYKTLAEYAGETVNKLNGVNFIVGKVTDDGKVKFISQCDKLGRPTLYYEAYNLGTSESIKSFVNNNNLYIYTAVDGELVIDDLEEGWYRIVEIGKDPTLSTQGGESGENLIPSTDFCTDEYKFFDIYIGDETTNTIDAPVFVANKKAISISGFVWDDSINRNELYNFGQEKSFNNIKVVLKDLWGNTVINKKGNYCITYTGEYGIYNNVNGGEYIFKDIDPKDIENYYVEFEYNGLLYQAVTPGVGSDYSINSKVTEANNRNELDRKFTNGIENNGKTSAKVAYRNDISIGYKNDSADTDGVAPFDKVIDETNIRGTNILARTYNSSIDGTTGLSLKEMYKSGQSKIEYVNMGLYLKQQADLSINKEPDNIKLHAEKTVIDRWVDVYDDEGNVVSSYPVYKTVYIDNNKTFTNKYDYKLIKADYRDCYLVDLSITYRIKVTNNSNYCSLVTSIADYFSTDFTFVSATTDNITNSSYTMKPLSVTYSGTPGFNKMVLDGYLLLEPYSTRTIYVTFNVNNFKSRFIYSDELNELVVKNIAEINSYRVYKDRFFSTVAVVDKDSVPGNCSLSNEKTFEDDSDEAPAVKIGSLQRKISGTVFEDIAVISGEGNVREGSRGFEEGTDKTLSGIEVKLILMNEYEKKPEVKKTTWTDANGNYEFKNFPSGNYIITFTWGSNEYRVQDYKCTIYQDRLRQTNEYWYRENSDTRYSDAMDDYNQRIEIDKEIAVTDRKIKEELDKVYSGGHSDVITKKTMDSSTPNMYFPVVIGFNDDIDMTLVNVPNIDFGIVERARQSIEVEKKISSYKITLANGQKIVDAKIDDDGNLINSFNYTTYMKPNDLFGSKGFIKSEMDSELIEGSTLEIGYKITYTNTSEVDYLTPDYYLYGIRPWSAQEASKVVSTIKPAIADYLDNKLTFNYINNAGWKLSKPNDLDAYYRNFEKYSNDYINSKVLLYKVDGVPDIEPKISNPYKMINNTATIELNASKLLATPDDMSYDENKIDTVQVYKRIVEGPGYANYKHHLGRPVYDYPSAESEKADIVPNTGENRAYIVKGLIAIAILLIVGTGICFIKFKLKK